MTSRVSPASSASGVVHANWCCIGMSGTFMPTMRPMLGPHIPAQLTTNSVSMRPLSVSTALTLPFLTSMPVTSVSP